MNQISPVLWQFLVKWMTNFALFPPEASKIAPQMDALYFFMVLVSLIGLTVVILLVVSFSILYSKKRHPQAVQIEGSTLELIGHARTGTNGTFVATVPGGPSRMVEIGYRAFSADGAYSATARVLESVRAGVKLSVSPRRNSTFSSRDTFGKNSPSPAQPEASSFSRRAGGIGRERPSY